MLTRSTLFWQAHPTPLRRRSMILVPREAQNLSQSMFSCMLIPFSMFLLDSDEGKVKYSPLSGKQNRSRSNWDTFLIEIGDLTKSALFWQAYPTPLRRRSMILGPNQKCTQILDDFGRSPFSIRNVAFRKSVQKNLIGTHFC